MEFGPRVIGRQMQQSQEWIDYFGLYSLQLICAGGPSASSSLRYQRRRTSPCPARTRNAKNALPPLPTPDFPRFPRRLPASFRAAPLYCAVASPNVSSSYSSSIPCRPTSVCPLESSAGPPLAAVRAIPLRYLTTRQSSPRRNDLMSGCFELESCTLRCCRRSGI